MLGISSGPGHFTGVSIYTGISNALFLAGTGAVGD